MIVSRRLLQCVPSLTRHFSANAGATMRPDSENYTVTEIQIPAPQGSYIAGNKLFQHFLWHIFENT